MKKLEASMIKVHQRINLGLFVSLALELVSKREECQEEK